MAPYDASVAAQLKQITFYHLDNDLLRNALFSAGRLHALDPRDGDGAHLLSLVHLRMGRVKAALEYSKDRATRGAHLGCCYVFAQACLTLGRYTEGVTALERSRGLWAVRNHWNQHGETTRKHLPDAAAVYALLGRLWRAQGDVKKAAETYAAALKLNPFMWESFTDLCDAGVPLACANVFKMTSEMRMSLLDPMEMNQVRETKTYKPTQMAVSTPGVDPFNPVRSAGDPGLNDGGTGLISRLNGLAPAPNTKYGPHPEWDTPSVHDVLHAQEDDVLMSESGFSLASEPPHAPVRKTRTLRTLLHDAQDDVPRMKPMISRTRTKDSTLSMESDVTRPTLASNNHKRTVSGHAPNAVASAMNADTNSASQRRSVRLFNQIKPSTGRAVSGLPKPAVETERRELRKVKATGTRGKMTQVANQTTTNRHQGLNGLSGEKERDRAANVLGGTNPMSRKLIQPHVDGSAKYEALQWLLDLYAKLGSGYYHLSRFETNRALQLFASVSNQQRETPWVLAQIGKAYYERRQYHEAEEAFSRVRKLAPAVLDDMEVYSTVLWHLRKEIEVSYLSHELIEQDRLSPQAWCAIGNSFSLQRDHDQAVKCFRRATQLDPNFAYAFTLQGHEHVENEEFDKALHAYRCAICADARHYNGWYGLAQVYEKLGKYEIAETHYKTACQINPSNPVLVSCIGTVLEKMKKPQAALVQYTHACQLEPKPAYARHTREKKARVLMSLRRPKQALEELEILKDIAPDSANVHFMLGRVYKVMKDKTAAIRHFTIAMNLDPKAAPYVKEQMESLENDDEDYDDDDFD